MDTQNPFHVTEKHDGEHEDSQEVLAERAIADAGQSQAMSNYNQKVRIRLVLIDSIQVWWRLR